MIAIYIVSLILCGFAAYMTTKRGDASWAANDVNATDRAVVVFLALICLGFVPLLNTILATGALIWLFWPEQPDPIKTVDPWTPKGPGC